LVFVSTVNIITNNNASQLYKQYVNQLNQSLSDGQFQLLVNSIYFQYNVTPEYIIESLTFTSPIISTISEPTSSPTNHPNVNKETITQKFEEWKIAAIVIFMCIIYILLTLNYYKPYSKIINLKTSIRDRILHFIENDRENENRNEDEENVGIESNAIRQPPSTLYQALLTQIVPHSETQEIQEIRIRDFNSDDASEILQQLEER